MRQTTEKIREIIDATFPLYKEGKLTIRQIAEEYNISTASVRQFRKGAYWAQKERQWKQESHKRRWARRAEAHRELMSYREEYRQELEKMRDAIRVCSHTYLAIAKQFASISARAAVQLSQAMEGDAIAACRMIDENKIAKVALDSSSLSKVGADHLNDLNAVYDLLELLDGAGTLYKRENNDN
ncbi:hypothetical protein [Roseofilum capinflatum]|uniref:Uncharacterized protein n=1 Tax=Roseofilum capinflatum BLCC-M114 TaxID=3022440 RepID=A0ABT7B6U9_9CYAN|nr:hypothetical protein [Roseofilum capinflatum]MDJ1174885.1 hypothetical protein [Roseofilum capinflatum BLCC-M114]